MIKKICNNKAGSLLIVLFYMLIASMMMMTLYNILLNTSSNATDASRYNVARKLAESKVQQVLGISDDLFDCATNQALFTSMKINSNEAISCSGASQYVNGQYFGTIRFANTSTDGKSSVECSRTQEKTITNLSIKKYDSIRLFLNTNKIVNLGFSGVSKLFLMIEYTAGGQKKAFPIVVSNSNANLQGAVIYNSAGLTQQPSVNGYPNLISNFMAISTDISVANETIKLYMNFNNLPLTGASSIDALNVIFLDNDGTMSGSFPNVDSNFAKVSCRAFDNVSDVSNAAAGTRTAEMEAVYLRNKSLPIYQYFGFMLNNFASSSSTSEIPSVLELGTP